MSAWVRPRPQVGILLGLLVWWPTGFWGITSWLHLPLHVLTGDVLLLGAIAAAAAVSLLVRSPWPRIAIVLVSSGIGWLLGAPGADRYPDEREVLLLLLVGAAMVGIVLGARGSKGPLGAATVLAVVAGVSPATWPHGPVLALALALPFAVATWHRVAPTLLSVLRVLLTWLVLALVARSVSYGWDLLHPGMSLGSKRAELRLVGEAMADFVRTQWWTSSEQLLRSTAAWFWVALGLALVIAGGRALVGRRRRPAGTTSEAESR